MSRRGHDALARSHKALYYTTDVRFSPELVGRDGLFAGEREQGRPGLWPLRMHCGSSGFVRTQPRRISSGPLLGSGGHILAMCPPEPSNGRRDPRAVAFRDWTQSQISGSAKRSWQLERREERRTILVVPTERTERQST